MRIAISAGHGKGDPGAVNPRLGLEEHWEAVKICQSLKEKIREAGHDCIVIPFGVFTLKEKIASVNEEHAIAPIDQAIEVHFNSNPGTPAHGTEVLYMSVKNAALAARMSGELAAAIGTADRGAKKRDGLGWLKQTKPPALIVEVLFINSDTEAAKILEPDFAERAAAGIVRGLISGSI